MAFNTGWGAISEITFAKKLGTWRKRKKPLTDEERKKLFESYLKGLEKREFWGDMNPSVVFDFVLKQLEIDSDRYWDEILWRISRGEKFGWAGKSHLSPEVCGSVIVDLDESEDESFDEERVNSSPRRKLKRMRLRR